MAKQLYVPTDSQRKLIIFDTTLRDGEQCPGVTLTKDEKLQIALQLCRLGVDVLEAGFPITSQGDFESVQNIARIVGPIVENRITGQPMVICGLARSKKEDIDVCYQAIKDAPKHRIHLFLASSDIHLKYKLKITREECIKRAVEAVKYAKSLGVNDIEFSPEDAGRSDADFLVQLLSAVVEVGASTLNIPDTVGYNLPNEFGDKIKYLVDNVPKQNPFGQQVIFSTHCHNDLGLATANSLSGLLNGASQVECTINGMGERAGNTCMEEIVMAIHTHRNNFPLYHTIDTRLFVPISKLVSKLSGSFVQGNKAIVGSHAFSHESGIHQDGIMKNRETYEIMEPSLVGADDSVLLVIGKHSGRNAFTHKIKQLATLIDNYIIPENNNNIINNENMMVLDKSNPKFISPNDLLNNKNNIDVLFNAFKTIADNKKDGNFKDKELVSFLQFELGKLSILNEN